MMFSLLFLMLFVCASNAFKLNYPKVLLPFHSQNLISFILELNEYDNVLQDKSCFEWSTSRPDIISIEPLYNDLNKCSTRANVSAISKLSTRAVSIISVRELSTGRYIRCDVISDRIQRISIKHTTTQLYLEDSPELFSINAFDSEGNTFTSLEGLSFKWQISHDSILRKINLISSKYAYSNQIRDLELSGLNAHKVLIEGLKTGTSKVKAIINDTFYEHMSTDEVELLVVANLIIEPSYPIYLLKNDYITYTIRLIRQKTIETIDFPSDQYNLESENTTVGQLKSGSTTLYGQEIGQTIVKLIDQNMKQFSNHYSPTQTLLYVVEPSYLQFEIKNWNSWILEIDRIYEIQISLITTQGHNIYITRSIKIDALFDKEKFEIISKTNNGTYCQVRTKKCGSTIVKGSLVSDTSINGQQSIDIFEPIHVEPSKIVFAYSDRAFYLNQFKATGGSGLYEWRANNSLLSIDSNGNFKISSKDKLSFRIDILDVKNVNIGSQVYVFIVEPNSFDIQPCPLEAYVRDVLKLHVKMKGFDLDGKLIDITDCSKLNFDVVVDDSFDYEPMSTTSMDPQACAIVNLSAKKSCSSVIKLAYKYGERILIAEKRIYAYERLIPSNEKLTLAKGSSFYINITNGPSLVKYQEKIIVDDQNVFNIFKQDSLSYRIECKLEGSQSNLKLVYTQSKRGPNECPLDFDTQVSINCAIPNSIELYRFPIHEHLPQCPLSKLFANKNSKISVGVSIKDKNGIKFDNFTSLKLTWSVDKADFIEDGHEILLHNSQKFYHTFQTKSQTGQISLAASHKKINGQIEIAIVDPIEVYPHQVTIFNLRKNYQEVNIKNGSGYYHLNEISEVKKLAKLDFQDNTLTITPLENGQMSIDVHDYCVTSDNNKAKFFLTIAELNTIYVDYDKDKLELGEEMMLRIKFGDSNNNYLSSKLFNLINLNPAHNKNFLMLDLNRIIDDYSVEYRLKALKVGLVSFQFKFNGISSKTYEIMVFEHLKVELKSIEIIVGSLYDIKISGGPQTDDTQLQFISEKDNFIDISSYGRLKAKRIGETLVIIQCVNKHNSNQIYSKDTLMVRVVQIKSIHIEMPIKSIKRNNSLPISLSINKPSSSVIFQSCAFINYTWQINGQNLVDIKNSVINSKTNLSTNYFSFILHAKKSGSFRIKVVLTSSEKGVLASDGLMDQQTLEIFDEVALFNNKNELTLNLNHLLVTPGSQIQFSTNKDLLQNVSYELNIDSSDVNLVSISNKGLLSISESIEGYCGVSLVVRIKEESNKEQVLNYFINVKPVKYFMLVSEHSSVNLDVFKFRVQFYDDLGDRLDYVSDKSIRIKTYFDLASIVEIKNIDYTEKDAILNMNILGLGQVNAFISLDNTYSQLFQLDFNEVDYFHVENGEYFTTDLIFMNTAQEFISETTSIVQIINKNTILSLKPGLAEVKCDNKKTFFVIVKSINGQIKFLHDTNQVIIISENYKNIIPIKFGPNDSNLKGFPISNRSEYEFTINQALKPFDCLFKLNENRGLFFDIYNKFFKINSIFKEGYWSCEISVNDDFTHKELYDTIGKNQFARTVSLWVTLNENNGLLKSNEIELPLAIAFHVQTNPIKLRIQESNNDNLVIHLFKNVVDSLKVHSTHSNLLQITKQTFSDNKQVFTVSLNDKDMNRVIRNIQENEIFIEISSDLTKQYERISIVFTYDDHGVSKEDTALFKKSIFGSLYDLLSKYIIEFLIFLVLTLVSILVYINTNSNSSIIPINRGQFQFMLNQASPSIVQHQKSIRKDFQNSTPFSPHVQRITTDFIPTRITSPIPTTEPIRLFSTDMNNQTIMDYERKSFSSRHKDSSPILHRSF